MHKLTTPVLFILSVLSSPFLSASNGLPSNISTENGLLPHLSPGTTFYHHPDDTSRNLSTLAFIAFGDSSRRDSVRNKSNSHYNGSSGSWSNLGKGCDDPQVALVAGVVLLSVAAIVVSNDVYMHRTYSFINPAPRYSNNFGLDFGVRKTFEHSAIELGGSYIHYYDYSNPNVNIALKEQHIWGAQLNYVHQVFYNHTSDRVRFYIGPTVNYFQPTKSYWNPRSIGFGGIAGAQLRVFERLNMDLRYTLTTESNQLGAGFFLTYQKKSPWEEGE